MKNTSKLFLALVSIIVFSVGCGGGDETVVIEGPTLSVGEALALVVDQFYVNGGLEDEYSQRGEFTLYFRDAATGKDVACARSDDGMKKLSETGVYFGGLSIPLVEVSGEHPQEMARFKMVFVEQDGDGCPDPIGEGDDIVGESDEFMFDALQNRQIWASNGKAAVQFRLSGSEAREVKAMAPALVDGLAIDEIYLANGEDGNNASTYYIFVDHVEGGRSTYQCQVADDLMEKIRYGNIVYAALGFPISCFSPTDAGFENINVRVGVYIQKDSGPTLVGETEPQPIGELIGETAEFTNGAGFVSFQGVMTTPFAAAVLRLGEIETLMATALQYELTPSFNSTIELHVVDSDNGYTIACSGASQGLTGVGTPGTYDGLSSAFVAADGQAELFGWKKVVLELVDRKDGLECPSPMGSEPTILAGSAALTPVQLSQGGVQFENGAGNCTLRVGSSDNN